jgi:hypothetical protein
MKPYLLIPITVIVGTLYFYSRFAYRHGMIKKSFHRKFWNYVLLITFLVTALLGIIQVILIDYKLEAQFVLEILVYHVNFGIAMSLIAVFHLWWHIKYYLPFLRVKRKNEKSRLHKKKVSGVDPKTG